MKWIIFFATVLLPISAFSSSTTEWPLSFAEISISPTDYQRTDREQPFDCQPEHFDPNKTILRLDQSSGSYGLVGEDADESVSIQIDGWIKQGDSQVVLPKPFSLTKYSFLCMSTASQVFMFKKDDDRHALYTHIEAARFSPDLNKLVMFNYLKTGQHEWLYQRRVVDYTTKQYSYLPIAGETTFLADVSNNRIVTYGHAQGKFGDYKNRSRVVAIWAFDGKLLRALHAPLQDTAANAYDSDDGIGMLPEEPMTFYHLTRTGKNICTLRLQDLANQENYRAIQLDVPGQEWDTVAVGMRVQIDLNGLKLNGGDLRYRVSESGRGDVTNDWGAWKVVQ